jgi:uncharacterized membrane protein (UPF0182 family)
MSSRRWLVWGIAAGALVLVAGRVVAGLYVDYRWYEAMGATAVWRARFQNALLLRGFAAGAGTLFLFANLYAVRQSVAAVVLPRRVANLEIGEEVPGRFLMAAVFVLSVVLGALLTLPHGSWTTLALARFGEPFNERDQYFQSDLGFFVYWLPLERALYAWSLIALLLAIAVVVFFYALTSSLRWERGGLRVSTYVRRHLTALGVILLLILAWSYRLDTFGVLTEGSGRDGAFAYVDHRVGIPVNLILQLVAIGAALVVLWGGWTGQMRLAFGAVSAVLVLSLVLRQLLPVVVGRVAEPGGPEVRERPYAAVRAGYTRRAYDVDRVARGDESSAFSSELAAARGTPIWDAQVLARIVDQAHGATAPAATVGWRASADGVIARVVARPAGGEAGAPWTAVAVRATETDDRGAPVVAELGEQPLEGEMLPQVLVAESGGGALIVADSTGRIPAAALDGWGARLAHAWSLQDFRILFSDLPHPHPRIVLRRSVRDRVHALAPFFAQGTAVTPIVARDSLYWALHLYSASGSYPLSRRLSLGGVGVSYLRHAAIAVVDAHSGRVTIVADSVPDPIARTWTRAFPELFSPPAALPAEVAAGLPPAIDGALAQAATLAVYDTRSRLVAEPEPLGVPTAFGADTLAGGRPPLLALGPTLAWTVPLVDAREHLRGVVVATGGVQPATVWRALDAPTARWSAVIERLRRPPEPLPGEREERVVRGPVRVAPLPAGALFVQPHYTWRTTGAPTLARVMVMAGDSVDSGRTLSAALGLADRDTPFSRPATAEEFRAAVQAAYDAMRAALRQGDWRAFGDGYEALGQLLGTSPR